MFKMQLIGQAALLQEVSAFQRRIRREILPPIVQEVGEMVAAAAKTMVPRESGLLAKSIGPGKVRTYDKGQTEIVYLAVGPRRGFGRAVVPKKRGGLKALGKKASASAGGQYRDPAKYGHLVEKGHRVAKGGRLARLGRKVAHSRETGRSIGFVVGRPFMEPAAPIAQQAQRIAEARLASAISQLNTRLGGK